MPSLVLPWNNGVSPEESKRKNRKHLTADQQRGLQALINCHAEVIIGIDEVGTGSWAGPIVVAAVALPITWNHSTVKDSKKLSPHRRRATLNQQIYPNALAHCTLWADNQAIDREGAGVVCARLTEACALYCLRRFPFGVVVQDGDRPIPIDNSLRNVVWMPKADALVPAVSAASILAKVSRDRYMEKIDPLYPGYAFSANKGYYSDVHAAGLARLGPSAVHRMSYKPLKAYVGKALLC